MALRAEEAFLPRQLRKERLRDWLGGAEATIAYLFLPARFKQLAGSIASASSRRSQITLTKRQRDYPARLKNPRAPDGFSALVAVQARRQSERLLCGLSLLSSTGRKQRSVARQRMRCNAPNNTVWTSALMSDIELGCDV